MGKYKYLMIFLIIAGVMFGCLGMYLVFGCRYSGREFSPDDFSVRHFYYQYEPLTGWVIRGRTFSDGSDYLMPDLVGDKYLKPVYKKEQTWHLINDNGSYSGGDSADSDARLLIKFLGLQDENFENQWTVFNSDNPKLAKVLWPLVAEMARDEMYLVIGDVLTFVLHADVSKPKQFEPDLLRETAKAYLKLGKIDFENNELESAQLRISKSIKYDSTAEATSLLKRIGSSIANGDAPVLLEAMPE